MKMRKMCLISLANIIPCVGFTQKNSNNDIKISFYTMSLELSLNHYYKLKKCWQMKNITKLYKKLMNENSHQNISTNNR